MTDSRITDSRIIKNFFAKKPVRRGAIYCSPWCGRNCTRAEYDRAVRKAKELCQELGNGWKPRVWENMGWFYQAHKGFITVSPLDQKRNFGITFWASVNSQPQFTGESHDPSKAVAKALAAFDAHIAHLQRQRKEVEA